MADDRDAYMPSLPSKRGFMCDFCGISDAEAGKGGGYYARYDRLPFEASDFFGKKILFACQGIFL